jgi:AGZA family xanthine/uracil permease-like MFS transporter
MSNSHLRREAIAGFTTFLTMAYIVIVNPTILATEGTGMPFSGVMTATVLLSFLMTLLMGLYAKLPFAVAPGMGINAFFTFTLVLGKGIPWPVALGIVFWSGVIFLLVSVTRVRESIARAIPLQLRIASAAGIGLFLTFIGMKNSGLVVADPATFVKFGGLTAGSALSIVGLFVTIWLMHKKSPLAFLGGISVVTVLAYFFGLVKTPDQILSWPDFTSVMFKLDIWGALQLAFLPAIISILFTDLFDSISTFVGVSQATGLVDEKGEPRNLRQGLIVDAFATFGAGLLGTSSGTAYIESSAGIESGGRTGLTAVFTAICFLPFLFLAPLAGMVPSCATAPVLMLVGALMFRSVTTLKVEKLEDLVPAFLTIVMIPLTFSITQGIIWGFISHTALFLLAGRRKEITPMMYALTAISIGLIVIESFPNLLH